MDMVCLRNGKPSPSNCAFVAFTFIFLAGGLSGGCAAMHRDPLPSWNDGPAKTAIINYVKSATTAGTPGYHKLAERIAVFDNDGTLWAEQPAYFQLYFAIDRVKALAPSHPEWKTTQPFKAVLDGDMAALAETGIEGLNKLVMASHAGLTTDEFNSIVRTWIASARHPKMDKRYTELVYQPMLEVLTYLRANGFKTFIVSGGGTEFIRSFAEDVYGIPPEQVIGSNIKMVFEMTPEGPVIRRLAELEFNDDKEGKPVGIERSIGRRPLIAFGNSDGDLQMLQWTAAGTGPRLCGIVHHTDERREWAYDRASSIGKLDKGLDAAREKGWLVVDMKHDWKTVFPPAK